MSSLIDGAASPLFRTGRPALVVSKLHKNHPAVTALDGVSFTVGRGEIVGLLGPNGAGKTTTINMILGVLEPSSGSVTIDEIDMAKDRARALRRTNFAAVYASLPGNLTVAENLRFFGLLYGIESLRARVHELIAEFDLAHLRDTKCGLLSSGEQTRAALAKALINRPTLLLLDEPTASLDPSAAQTVRALIKGLAVRDGCGILWTPHNMILPAWMRWIAHLLLGVAYVYGRVYRRAVRTGLLARYSAEGAT